jgi:hypothetical protein
MRQGVHNGANAGYRRCDMDEHEELTPFAQRLERVLRARYRDTEGLDYLLDPQRLAEAQVVEQFVWAFRVTEVFPSGTPGIGRIDPGGPPRLAETLKPRRFAKWGIEHDLAAAEINDLLIAYGYDLGMSAEADGEAELLAEVDRERGWETVVALCQAPNQVLTDYFDMSDDLLAFGQDMAVRNIDRVAKEGSGFRLSNDFPRTGRLLVNVGLLLRAVQQDIGPKLWELLTEGRLEAVRARWPTPLHAGAGGRDR